MNSPTFVGLTLTYKEQGPGQEEAEERDDRRRRRQRLKREQDMFKPQSQKAAEKQEEQRIVDAWDPLAVGHAARPADPAQGHAAGEEAG